MSSGSPAPETLPSQTQEVEKEALIEKHARFAVLEVQHQNNSYQPTPYEANALKNHRHILRRFADELSALLAAPARQPTEEKDLSRVDRQPTSERRPTASRDRGICNEYFGTTWDVVVRSLCSVVATRHQERYERSGLGVGRYAAAVSMLVTSRPCWAAHRLQA